MKKLFCMIALGAIIFGSVLAEAPVRTIKPGMNTDTTKLKKKVKTKNGKTKIKLKDTTSNKM